MNKNLANIITFTRIIATSAMIFTSILSNPFFVFYTYAGFSDILDGFIARKFKIESDFGRKLDSASDLFFFTVMMIKLWPYLEMYLPLYVWILIWTVLGLRLVLYLYVFISQKMFLSIHTYLNKTTGCLMFGLPFMVKTPYFVIYSILVVIIAIISVIYETYLVFTKKIKQ